MLIVLGINILLSFWSCYITLLCCCILHSINTIIEFLFYFIRDYFSFDNFILILSSILLIVVLLLEVHKKWKLNNTFNYYSIIFLFISITRKYINENKILGQNFFYLRILFSNNFLFQLLTISNTRPIIINYLTIHS